MYGCKKDEVKPTIENESQGLKENKLLWEVSGNGLEKPFHLFGTIHLIDKNQLTFLPALETILQSSTGLVLEIDVTSPEIADASRKRLLLPSTVDPKIYYTKDQWNLMSNVCNRVGFSFQFIQQVKPFVVMSLVLPKLLSENENQFTGYDYELAELAQQYNVKTSGLETAGYVYTYLDSIPLADQYEGLYKTIDQYDKDPETLRSEYNELINAYENQDINQLLEYGKEDKLTYDQLIAKRNYNWLTKINSSFAGKLVAVGAGHLAGDEGLLELLILRGYTIKSIN